MTTPTSSTPIPTAPRDGAAAPVVADIFHDIVCPWCRIGLASLRQALAERAEDDSAEDDRAAATSPPVELHWHPFLLNPGTPDEGEPFQATLAAKMGQDPAPMLARVSEAGAAYGLTFNWDRITTMPNSIAAHTLYAILPPEHRTAMIDRLHTAYFEDGRDIGDPAVLRAIAGEHGLDAEVVGRALASPELRQAIVAEAAQAAGLGISGVPLVIFDTRAAVSGAQAPEAFRATLDQVIATRAEG